MIICSSTTDQLGSGTLWSQGWVRAACPAFYHDLLLQFGQAPADTKINIEDITVSSILISILSTRIELKSNIG